MYSKHIFVIWNYISRLIDCFVETRNYSILSLTYSGSLKRMYYLRLYSLFVESVLNVFAALKGTHVYILFVNSIIRSISVELQISVIR